MDQYRSNATGIIVEAVQWDGSGAPPPPLPATSGLAIIRWIRATSIEPDGGVTRNSIHLPGGAKAWPLDYIVHNTMAGKLEVYTPAAFASEFTEMRKES